MAENHESITFIAFLPILFGSLMFAGAAWYWNAGRELRSSRVPARATITGKRPATGPLGDYNQFTLQFTDTLGNVRVVDVKERKIRSARMRAGMSVAVVYIPARPESAQLGYLWAKKLEAWIAAVFGLFGCGMVAYGLSLFFGGP